MKLITKEEFLGTGKAPDDDWLIDEWIENGGKFAKKGQGKRGNRPDRESKVNVASKAASKSTTNDKKNSVAKGKRSGGKSTKSTTKTSGKGTKRSRTESKKKLTKEEKNRKKAKLKKQLELLCLSSSSDDGSDDGIPIPRKKSAVELGCEAVRKEMEEDHSDGDDDDDDDKTVGIEEEGK